MTEDDYRSTDPVERPTTRRGLTYQTVVHFLWSSSGTAVQFVSSLVVLVVLARVLPPSAFGMASAAMATIALCETVRAGIGPAIVRAPRLDPEDIQVAFGLAVASSLVLACAVTGLATTVASFFSTPQLGTILPALALILPLRGLGTVAKALLQRDLDFRRLAAIQAVSFGLGFALPALALAAGGFGVWALVWPQVIQCLMETVLFFHYHPHSVRIRLEPAIARRLVSYSGGVFLSEAANTVAINGDNVIVGHYLGVTALGLYSRAYRLMSLPANLLGDVVESVLLSTMARIQDERERLVLSYLRGTALCSLVMLPISASSFVLAPEIVLVLLGSKWTAAILPFRILSLGIFFRVGRKMGATLARATGAVYRLGLRMVLDAVLVVTAALVAQSHGLAGVSFAVTVVLAWMYISMVRLGSRVLQLPPLQAFSSLVPSTLTALLVAGATYGAAAPLRHADRPALVVLLVGLAAGGAIAALACWSVPRVFLGKEGIWWATQFQSWIGGRFTLRRRPSDA